MDWDAMRVVLAIARAQSLSGAAKALQVTHSTVGRRLARLEADLGVRVFDRTPDGYVATDAGIELVAVAESMEAQLQRVESQVRGQDLQLEGKLRVTTLDFLFDLHAPAFASFCDRYPDIELTVTCTETEVSLFRREADVAFRMTNRPPETLIGRRIGELEFALYGHRDLVANTRDLSALPWLHWDEELVDYARWMDGLMAQLAPGARTAIRLGENTLLRRSAMRQGLGVHPLPCLEGDRYPELVRIGPVLEAFTRQLWLLTLPALRNTPRVRAFLDHMADSLPAPTRSSKATSP